MERKGEDPGNATDLRTSTVEKPDKVVAVTSGYSNMELITRAKTKLIFILACHDGYKERYHTTREYFQQAGALGLVDHQK